MTVIVGVLCQGGVAIASDRQVTGSAFLPLLQPVPIQTSVQAVTKVSIISQDVLLGVSGLPAIGDEYETAIKREAANFASRNYELATRRLREEIRQIVKKNAEPAELLAKAIGPAAYSQITVECLLAANFKDGPRLIQILPQSQFDVARTELPIKAIGSGQLHADPFLLYLRNTFWPDRLPTVEEGILAACWAVDYAIEVGAPLVGAGRRAATREFDAFFLGRNGGKTSGPDRQLKIRYEITKPLSWPADRGCGSLLTLEMLPRKTLRKFRRWASDCLASRLPLMYPLFRCGEDRM